MSALKSDFLKLITERGQFHQASDLEGLDAAMKSGFPGYIGYDLTAPSLHVGNLAQIMLQRRFQQAGGKPIVLLGSGTTRIGDPSGRDESRQLLTSETIEANHRSIRKVFERFLTFGNGPTDAIEVDNSDWLLDLNLVEFLRDVGRHFSVNRMLTMDSVKLRLDRDQSLSFIEFSYMVLMAYDFVVLNREYRCRLQMGGSDQWGNIIMGVELGRRMDGADLFALTQPLITTADGAKMGKTAQGAIWLNEDLLSPYDYWQFWRNTQDADVGRFLRLFTDLPLDEIGRLEKLAGAEINDAKIVLATEATAMLHGRAVADTARDTARTTFAEGGAGADLPTLKAGASISVLAALTGLGFCASNGEAKRKIAEGAVRIDDQVVSDPSVTVPVGNDPVKISLGKKRHGLLIS
jgi:tyrosyl-tRNA synthetase